MTDQGPRNAVPGDSVQPSNAPVDESVHTVPLDLDEGPDVVIGQQNVGPGNQLGGGEFPDPDTPPTDPAPGSAQDAGDAARDHEDIYNRVSPEQAASGGGGKTRPDD